MEPVETRLPETRGWTPLVYAKDQPEYLPLPVMRSVDGRVVSRWTLTDEEREAILAGADIFLTVHTFNVDIQHRFGLLPVSLVVDCPMIDPCPMVES